MTDPIAFSALLCSRLCHDLISPVGAFTNGLELLADEDNPEMQRQVIELLEQSAQQTASRLQFFRLAFGAGAGFGEMVAMDTGRDAVAAYFAGGKVTVDWRPAVRELSKDGLKALLNVMLLAGESLIRGGTITVDGDTRAAGAELRITAAGDRLLLPPEIEMMLTGGASGASHDGALTPKLAPAFLARTTLVGLGGQVTVAREGDGIVKFVILL